MTKILALVALLLASVAQAQAPNTATITFAAPTQRVDGSPIEGVVSYKLHQGLRGQPKAIVSTFTGTTATVTTGLLPNIPHASVPGMPA